MVLTMAAVAAAKGMMPPAGFQVSVHMAAFVNEGDGASFESEISLNASYSERERRILFNSARSCELHHILRGPVTFRESLHGSPSTRSTAARSSWGPKGFVM